MLRIELRLAQDSPLECRSQTPVTYIKECFYRSAAFLGRVKGLFEIMNSLARTELSQQAIP